jgi:hypothetical protein
MEKNLRVLGIAMAMQIFHPVGLDETGQIVWRKRPTRQALLPCIAPLSPVVIGRGLWGRTLFGSSLLGAWPYGETDGASGAHPHW